ncbi:aldehyde dehydrogenase family protein [Rhodococcus sp. NPDC056960]|uniref:aldehyde dehydrogenase family protein n=1 Tax=Rhodococcus sp. NPDC056960 TaxID=3345982 RepID=UPI00363EC474
MAEHFAAEMVINGRRVISDSTVGVLDPATEEVWAVVPECSDAQLDEAFAAAAEAQPAWSRDEEARRKGLRSAADVLRRNEDELSELLTREQGKSRADSRMEIQLSATWLDKFAEMPVPESSVPDDCAGFAVSAERRPLGVVAAITPWNFPVTLACWKLGPAFRAGNTVVLKPSPYTPVSTLRFGALIADVLPPGVVNVVSGGDSLGARMTTHRIPAKVSFTGSVATGKAVARSAADDLKRITLELGGNDPAILLDDVDPEAIAEKLFTLSFANNGQLCGCIKRIYVPAAHFDRVAELLSELARGVRVGPGMVEGTDLGPINNRPQYERVLGLLEDAISHGAKAIAGGEPPAGPGYFLPPTVLVDVAPDSRIVQVEQFGPVLPLVRYTDLDAVIDDVNSSKFGLGASVWGRDVDRARAIGRRLESGTVFVNAHSIAAPNIPVGGTKWSGLGMENGLEGLHEYTQLKVTFESQDS